MGSYWQVIDVSRGHICPKYLLPQGESELLAGNVVQLDEGVIGYLTMLDPYNSLLKRPKGLLVFAYYFTS